MLSSGAPLRLFGTGPQYPLPFGTVRPIRTKWRAFIRSYLAERRAFVRLRLSVRSNMAERRPFVQSNRTEQRRSVQFCLVEWCQKGGGRWDLVPESREGASGESQCRGAEGAPREYMPGSERRVLGKEEETEGKGMVPEREKGAVPERKQGGDGAGGVLLRRRGDGVASEEGEETGGGGGVERKSFQRTRLFQ